MEEIKRGTPVAMVSPNEKSMMRLTTEPPRVYRRHQLIERMASFVDEHRKVYGFGPICATLPIAPPIYYEQKARQQILNGHRGGFGGM